MYSKKIVKLCAIIVFYTVLFVCTFTFTGESDTSLVLSDYVKTTQNYAQTNVSTVTHNISQENNEQALPGISDNFGSAQIPIDKSSWLGVCDSVHKQWGAAGFIYKHGGYVAFKNESGADVTVRTDCSGYVSYCLYVAGYSTGTHSFSSASDYSTAGFSKVSAPAGGWRTEDLVPGDIVAWPGSHVQIYAGPNDDWYNWGSHHSCEDKYTNISDIKNVDSQVHSLTAHKLANATVFRAP